MSPDDGLSYEFLLDEFPDNLIVLESAEVSSGLGQARNRGIDAAKGDFIVMLDAGDVWCAGVLAELLPLAQDHGLAFLRANPVTPGMLSLRTPPLYGPDLTLREFGLAMCSVRPFLHKSLVQGYYGMLIADTVHDAALLARHGPCPLLEAGYAQVIRSDAVRARDYSRQFQAEYAAVLASCLSEPGTYGLADLSSEGLAQVAWVFKHRLAVSKSFEKSGEKSYEEWVAGTEFNFS